MRKNCYLWIVLRSGKYVFIWIWCRTDTKYFKHEKQKLKPNFIKFTFTYCILVMLFQDKPIFQWYVIYPSKFKKRIRPKMEVLLYILIFFLQNWHRWSTQQLHAFCLYNIRMMVWIVNSFFSLFFVLFARSFISISYICASHYSLSY